MVVQARLDSETEKLLALLTARLGVSQSAVVREGIRVLAAIHPPVGQRRIAGQGQFDSGVPDLATNKKYMKDFGR